MNGGLRWALAGLTVLHVAVAFATTPMDEAKATADAARSSLLGPGVLTDAEELIKDATPGYTSSPPEIAYDDPQEFGVVANQRLTECSDIVGDPLFVDPACEGILNANTDAGLRAHITPAMRSDPEVVQAVDATRDVTLSGLTGTYSDCVDEELDVGIKTRDVQYCHNYHMRELGLKCTKTRTAHVTWHCPTGSEGPLDDGDIYFCRNTVKVRTCSEGQTISPDQMTCFDNETGDESPSEEIDAFREFEATAMVLESWSNPCANYESRTPPEGLPPDGEPTLAVPYAPTGRVDKCERVTSVCTDDAPETRYFNRYPITHSCWAYSNTFDCVSTEERSDCGEHPRFGSCNYMGKTCIDTDQSDGFCTAERLDYDCSFRDTTRTETRLNCGAQTFTDREGNAWDASYLPDADLAEVVTYMEMGRQAGRYMDQNNLTVFNGFENSCKKKLFGLINCCSKAGGFDPNTLNNLATAYGVVGTVGKALASTYMYDALIASDAPSLVISGFSALFGTGVTGSALGAFVAGQMTFTQFAWAMMPGPWTIVMLAIQFSGLLDCDDKEQLLGVKRGSDLCVDNGNRCSKRTHLTRTCIERTYSYCCFNSRLAKLINRQGRAQLGITGLGCEGFTVAQLQSLDLSAMDLSEFMDEVRAAALEMPSIAPERLQDCAQTGGTC